MLGLKLEDLTVRIEHTIKLASSAASFAGKDTLEYKAAEEFLQSLSNFYEKKESIFSLKERIVSYEPSTTDILDLERNKEAERSSLVSLKRSLWGAFISASAYIAATMSLYETVDKKASLAGLVFLIPMIYFWSKADSARKTNYESSDKKRKLEAYLEKQKKKRELSKRELQFYPEWMYCIALDQSKERILKWVKGNA